MKLIKDLKIYKNKKILITGSTGFKGAWLSFWLYTLGARVVGVGLKPEKNSILFNKLNLKKKINQYFVNIVNFKKINKIVKKEKPVLIFHLAAQSIVSNSFDNPLNTFNTNILGSLNILEAFRLNNIKGLVYITSDKCYLNLDKKKPFKENDLLGGKDNYSASKASAENIFFSYHHSYFLKTKSKYLSAVTARAGNVIGGGDMKKDRVVPDIIKSIINKKSIYLRHPNATRPWQHVLEPLSGYLILGQKILTKSLKKNLIPSYNFGPKLNKKRVIDITRSILRNLKNRNKIFINKKKFNESTFLSLNISKAKKELNWQPKLNFNKTILFTSDWYKCFLLKKDLIKMTKTQIFKYMREK